MHQVFKSFQSFLVEQIIHLPQLLMMLGQIGVVVLEEVKIKLQHGSQQMMQL